MDRMIELVSGVVTFIVSSFLAYRLILARGRSRRGAIHVAFLHPNCNAGGGGERVLWTSIAAVQRAFPDAKVTVYGAYSRTSNGQIYANAHRTFGIRLERPPAFVRLLSTPLSDPEHYPRLTMALQALGMFWMGLECILRLRPNVVIDTQGCAFAYPWFWLAAVPIVAYVHYPFISSDMLSAVNEGRVAVNNPPAVARSRILSRIKRPYYRLVAVAYSLCGAMVDLAMANSTWTRDHIISLWRWTECSLVYPPCDLSKMQAFDIQQEREPIIFSLAQFRPEKNLPAQVHILKRLLDLRPEWRGGVKLVLFGGCRNSADRARAAAIEALAKDLDVQDSVEVHTNVTHEEILAMLSQATVGLHTMVEEHFGINIVEFMASGLVAVANDSGGPKSDILRDDTEGFLCSTVEEYARTIEKVLAMPEANRREMREKARSSAIIRFDSTVFEKGFIEALRESVKPPGAKKAA